MMVLVDTSVWSLALRRRPEHLSGSQQNLTRLLAELIREGRAQIIGPIRQELLSGIREQGQFTKIRHSLRAFPEPLLDATDYEEAASMNNQCRARGLAGSAIDFLICAAAHRRGWLIFTGDRDFHRYAGVLAIRLYSASLEGEGFTKT